MEYSPLGNAPGALEAASGFPQYNFEEESLQWSRRRRFATVISCTSGSWLGLLAIEDDEGHVWSAKHDAPNYTHTEPVVIIDLRIQQPNIGNPQPSQSDLQPNRPGLNPRMSSSQPIPGRPLISGIHTRTRRVCRSHEQFVD